MNAKEVRLDIQRSSRTGFSEVIYCPGKSDEQLKDIAQTLKDAKENFLFSRATEAQYKLVASVLPDAVWHDKAHLIGIRRQESPLYKGLIVAAAGSTDVPVAEEACVTAEYMGCDVTRFYDIGVAGLHRLMSCVDEIQAAKAIVAVAGMEGALPTVLGGLARCPVVAVPTSVGYGVNMKGLAPLMTMLNSCALGVSVVNIDNGLGAGYIAATIIRQLHTFKN